MEGNGESYNMKFIHIADLHIGKKVNEFNLLEDQKHILGEILKIADEEKPVGIFMAGDIYDKSVPPGDAVGIFDDFLTELATRNIQIFVVSGNHDSPERLNFGSRIMQKNGVHIAGSFDGTLKHIPLEDETGTVNVYLLPFIKPAMVNVHFPDSDTATYESAVKTVIDATEINTKERNVLIAHQFITSGGKQPETSDSETVTIGGLDNIDAAVFDAFDYVALGHLHGPQAIGRDTVRYAGSPLKYSFSEALQKKSVTLVDLSANDEIEISKIPLVPLRDMREVKGPIEELIKAAVTHPENLQDYVRAILTDEGEIFDAIGQLRQVFPNIMRIEFENSRSELNADSKTSASGDVSKKSPMELFIEFFTNQNNIEMTEEEQAAAQEIFEQAEGGAK